MSTTLSISASKIGKLLCGGVWLEPPRAIPPSNRSTCTMIISPRERFAFDSACLQDRRIVLDLDRSGRQHSLYKPMACSHSPGALRRVERQKICTGNRRRPQVQRTGHRQAILQRYLRLVADGPLPFHRRSTTAMNFQRAILSFQKVPICSSQVFDILATVRYAGGGGILRPASVARR